MKLKSIPGPIERVWAKSSGLISHSEARAADNNLGPFEAHFLGLKYFAEKIKKSRLPSVFYKHERKIRLNM